MDGKQPMLGAKEALIGAITAAFDGVSREDGTTLHEADELDNRSSPEELQAARKLDTDTRWQDVPDKWIEEFSSAYFFLDAKGFRYYLPAVMIWCLRLQSQTRSSSDDNVVSLLLDPLWNRLRDTFFPILTDAQRRVIALWIEYFMKDAYGRKPDEISLEMKASCWGRFLDP